jgi:hypothetical protein
MLIVVRPKGGIPLYAGERGDTPPKAEERLSVIEANLPRSHGAIRAVVIA